MTGTQIGTKEQRREAGDRRGQGVALGVLAVVTVLSLVPGTWSREDDSFPLSSYPMFSRNVLQEARTTEIVQAVGVHPDGARTILPPRAVANDEVLQAHRTLTRALLSGDDTAYRLCRAIAERLATGDQFAAGSVQTVELVVYRYDPVAYFMEDREPESEDVRMACGVGTP